MTAIVHARVVLIGDSSVGKTCLVNRLLDDTFDPLERLTIGADWQLYVHNLNGDRVELQIWDTAGQEKFRSLCPLYYRGAAAAVAVFDVTNRATFEHLEKWIDSFMEVAGTQVSIAVAANKLDREGERVVSQKESQEWASAREWLIYQTSAKTGENVAELFQALAELVLHRQLPKDDGRKQVHEGETSNCC
jgi:small GTP-binding protein